MSPRLSARALSLLPFLLAGCGTDPGGYPSLAPRPVENVSFDEPAPPPDTPVVADPALDARIAGVTRERADAARRFDTAAARAERLARAARGAAAGSERWIEAQTALAELDSLRAEHGNAVSALEDLAAERMQALAPAYPSLDAALAAARTAAAA